MFKLKKGNVFEKINNMDRKQAYTIGAIGAVLLVALLMLGSFAGGDEDGSLDNFNARGYDLATMPFVNDEAEQFLLSSKYPDMQGNGSSLLFSLQDKEERQEADEEFDEEGDEEEEFDEQEEGEGGSSGGYSGGRSGGGYGGGRGGSGGRTNVGTLGNASMGHSGGSGMSGSFGAPRGDYSPYKTQKKGEEKAVEFKNADARRALSQFAQASRATAGLRDNKLVNAKKALQTGNIQGSEAFAGKGIDLSKTGGLALDTNAPVGSSPDLSDLGNKVNSQAHEAEDKQDEKNKEKSFLEQALEALGEAVIDVMKEQLYESLNNVMTNWRANGKEKRATREEQNQVIDLLDKGQDFEKLTAEDKALLGVQDKDEYNALCKQWDDQKKAAGHSTAYYKTHKNARENALSGISTQRDVTDANGNKVKNADGSFKTENVGGADWISHSRETGAEAAASFLGSRRSSSSSNSFNRCIKTNNCGTTADPGYAACARSCY